MQRVLIAWVGDQDLKAAVEPGKGLGPIAPAVTGAAFDRVVLLNNRDKAWVKPYADWLRPQTNAALDLRHLPLKDPTDHEAIFRVVRPVLEELSAEGTQLTVHLSPGTPSMHAVWVLLCKTQFRAELIQSSREAGVRRAEIPFDIYAELIPELLRAPGEALAREAFDRAPVDAAFTDILHRSKEMRDVIQMAERVAVWPVHVLIEGESGTGKELFARAIHKASPRHAQPFIPLNCGAIPKDMVEAELFGYAKGAFTGATSAHDGAFLQAHGGTLFLDELGELPLDAQVKLLRAVEQSEIRPLKGALKKVDVRIVAATNRSVPAEISAGRFREDLFYRLATAVLRLPPLRARRGDVSMLLDYAVERANEMGAQVPGFQKKTLSASARSLLQSHPWPGNVRELVSTVRRAAIWTDGQAIRAEDARRALLGTEAAKSDNLLHRALEPGFELSEILEEVTRHYIMRALETAGGVKKEAAELLGFSNYQTLTNWMKKYGIEGG